MAEKKLTNVKKLNFNQKIIYHFCTLLIDEDCWILHELVSYVLSRANGVVVNTDEE